MIKRTIIGILLGIGIYSTVILFLAFMVGSEDLRGLGGIGFFTIGVLSGLTSMEIMKIPEKEKEKEKEE